jgi:hypothetical protein
MGKERLSWYFGSQKEATMSDATLQVEAARIPDRDRLLQLLQAAGVDARPVNEVGIEVPCADTSDPATDDLLGEIESVIFNLGAPFVPIKHEGVIYIRPPVS